MQGIVKLLQKLKPAKSAGPDNIPTRILKEYALHIAPVYKLSIHNLTERVYYQMTGLLLILFLYIRRVIKATLPTTDQYL